MHAKKGPGSAGSPWRGREGPQRALISNARGEPTPKFGWRGGKAPRPLDSHGAHAVARAWSGPSRPGIFPTAKIAVRSMPSPPPAAFRTPPYPPAYAQGVKAGGEQEYPSAEGGGSPRASGPGEG